MARTRGRKALPLPASLEHGLTGLGMVQVGEVEPRPWSHPLAVSVRLSIVASNIPGDGHVVASFGGMPERLEPDVLLGRVMLILSDARAGVRQMR